MDQQPTDARTIRPGRITAGLIVLAVGLAMLLDAAGLADVRIGHLIAPLVLIVLGSVIVLEKGAFVAGCRETGISGRPRMRMRRHGGSTGGLWLILVGVWMLVSQTHMFGLSFHSSWPLLVVFAGVMITLRGMR
jgi:hypothetical protein